MYNPSEEIIMETWDSTKKAYAEWLNEQVAEPDQ